MPAPAVITCPACQKRFKGKPELGGKKIKCPQCAEPFIVPNEEPPAPSKAKAAAPAKSNIEPPKDDESYGVGRIDITPRCPHCAQEMSSADAIICVYCGYNTMTRELGKTKKLIGVSREEHLKHLLPAIITATIVFYLIVQLILINTTLTEQLIGGSMSWAVGEWARVWGTIIHLAIIWPLSVFTFKRFAIEPMPPEVEKSEVKRED